jgi:NADH:ubiquinone oxidoreductase subunit D
MLIIIKDGFTWNMRQRKKRIKLIEPLLGVRMSAFQFRTIPI